MGDWLEMKTEYITTDISYRKLAAKYGHSYSQVQKVGKEEKWQELRNQHRAETVSKTLDKISENQADKVSRIYDLSDRLLDKVEEAIGQLNDEDGIVDRRGLRQLSATLRDLKEIRGEVAEDDEGTGVILLAPRGGSEDE